MTLEAEARFEDAVGSLKVKNWGEEGFSITARAMISRGRRLDASFHNPGVATIRRHLAKNGKGTSTICSAGYRVWVPGRYKRIPASDGVVYRDSADILEVSPDLQKHFADCRFGDEHRGRVQDGWILIPCSGQVYGIIGTAVLATPALDGHVVSNHVMRVAPNPNAGMRVGFLLTALSHMRFGRPVLKSLAFGSSVPEINPDDIAHLDIVRLDPANESAIAELAEESARVRAEADLIEREMATEASEIIDRFILGA